MRFNQILSIIFFFYVLPLHAQIEVSIGSIEGSTNKSLVELQTKNTYDQGIKDARAWIFLMDADGNVVGNKAQWIVGGDSPQQKPLASEESRKFKIAVYTKTKPTTAKVTFSRVILEDGTLVDPRKAAVTSE